MSNETPAALDNATVLAGPILRRVTPRRIVLWLAFDRPRRLSLALFRGDDGARQVPDDRIELARFTRDVQIGSHAWLAMIDVDLDAAGVEALTLGEAVGYDLQIEGETWLTELEPGLCYRGEARPRFAVKSQLDTLLHGSCRRPHCDSGDGMARADRWLAGERTTTAEWPVALLLTGDQIYADDVAGPLLRAIHVLIERLGLWGETLEGASVDDSASLYASPHTYYDRDELLPDHQSNSALRDRFFGGTAKPVFTSASSGNHLITLAEVMAMYLLCFSDTPWRGLDYERPELSAELVERYDEEARIIDEFVGELPGARRIMANVPTLMIFDDHDITDDWNLTAAWCESAYSHPFSRRIIGNAMVAYLLCQAWGNRPEAFESLWPTVQGYAEHHTADTQNALIDSLMGFREWGFVVDTEPAIVVLDTRTRRWHRSRNPTKPSGLMDWEALTDMQTTLLGHKSVVLVSAAPIFGVKLIENIQRVFTWFGKPLMVDAENWMAHRGAAHTILNVFRHRSTPTNFTVLSGDVHYSFAYDVRLRFSQMRQRIWQITSSGVKNEFPRKLLDWFDRLNRWIYAPWSPLNWFTKRRRMRVSPRRPSPADHGERLVNGSGIGYVRFNPAGQPIDIREFRADQPDVVFDQNEDLDG